MADARLRRFDCVVVWKLDRFGRSLVHCVNALQELQALGVRFVAVSQGIDTDEANPAAKLLMHILAAVAQFERELIRERVSAGIKHAKAKGVKLGRPKRVFDRGKVAEMRAAGASYAAIAKALGVGEGTVVRVARQKPSACAA
jgi:DNA invertase Pin-like site-specific DNA recombinase